MPSTTEATATVRVGPTQAASVSRNPRSTRWATEAPALIRQCIYCRTVTTGSEGKAHVLPEAIVENNLVLPRGSVCDVCNNYLGELDTALATHPLIAFGIQAFALPGRTGRSRVRLGKIGQKSDGEAQLLTLLPGAIDRLTTVEGRSLVVLANPTTAAQRRFHRALHHVAFNLLCYVGGAEEALKSSYDAVRRYVRSPSPRELWPYLYSSLGKNPVDIIDIFCLSSPTRALLRFFNHAFAVDLTRSGGLRQELSRLLSDLQWTEVPASHS